MLNLRGTPRLYGEQRLGSESTKPNAIDLEFPGALGGKASILKVGPVPWWNRTYPATFARKLLRYIPINTTRPIL
jgi:hypothetical protein